MDNGLCNVIYFDTRAHQDVLVEGSSSGPADVTNNNKHKSPIELEINQNVESLLSIVPTVYLCHTAAACLAKLEQYYLGHTQPPTIVVTQVYHEQGASAKSHQERSLSPRSEAARAIDHLHIQKLDGIQFLRHVTRYRKTRKELDNVILVALLVGNPSSDHSLSPSKGFRGRHLARDDPERTSIFYLWTTYMDAGAVDVMTSPFHSSRAESLTAHIYSFQKGTAATAKRKTSWVGVGDARPYAYLREVMVSGLMDRICDPENVDETIDSRNFHVPETRRKAIAAVVGSWNMSAHDFNDDELLYGVSLMIQHTLKLPGLKAFRISDAQVLTFLLACQRVYNSFVIYHNFRHACDVVQATFVFLISIGIIPPFPESHDPPKVIRTPVAQLLSPLHALTLVVSAMGHDVGHPGVNNVFLVKLNAPLAQLYNDRSVLESFHCAAFSQILRRYWPAAFSDITMRKLMISVILATDMALHSQYVSGLGRLLEKYSSNGNTLDSVSAQTLEEYKDLVCCLLLKCADICNVARRYSTATQWANILSEEFANQGMMEQELRMETCLFGGPPELGNIIKLGTSQIGFMDFFAIPLFRTMSLLLPGMTFTIDEIHANKAIWERTIETEKQRASKSTSSTDDRAPSQSQRMTGLELTQSGRSSFITSSPSSRETSGGHRSHFAGVPDPRKTSLGPPVVSSLPSANTSMSTSQTSNVLAQPLSPPAMVTSPIQVDGVRVVQGGQDEGCGASPNVDRKKERKFSFKFWRKSSV